MVPATIAFDLPLSARECAAAAPSVVLLHGSPGGRFDFHGLPDALARDRCVIAPDLPGFGDSTRDVPDYGVAAHAAYVDALLAALPRPGRTSSGSAWAAASPSRSPGGIPSGLRR